MGFFCCSCKLREQNRGLLVLGSLLGYVAHNLDIPLEVKTSKNVRASEVASLVAFFNNFHLAVDARLNCANYLHLSEKEIDRILGYDNRGSLVWRREVVDGVCGEGTFDKITREMRDTVSENLQAEKINVLVTHTPQMNAIDVTLGCEPIRLPELGFRIITKERSLQFPQNVFSV